MKKIILTIIAAFLLIGCSSSDATNVTVEPKIVVGKSLLNLSLNDQHGKVHTLTQTTQKLLFALSKDSAHTCNDFFATKDPTYLSSNKTLFIADVSAAPSLIRSMFIMPGLKDLKHTVLILDDESVAAPFRLGVDTEKIIALELQNGTITKIQTLSSTADVKKFVETH